MTGSRFDLAYIELTLKKVKGENGKVKAAVKRAAADSTSTASE